MAAIRADFNLSDLGKAQATAEVVNHANSEISAAFTDLMGRRQVRFYYLQTLMPIGPDIDPDSSHVHNSGCFKSR